MGGSTAIHILGLVYPSKTSIDAWGALGNEGWSWDKLVPYYQRFHTYRAPAKAAKEALGVNYVDTSMQGHSGPIQSSYPTFVNPLTKAWPKTLKSLGWPITADPLTGDSIGGFSGPYTVNPDGVVRSHAGNEYYAPIADRPNLHLQTEAQVTKILFEKGVEKPVASGVTFLHDGAHTTVKARKEVILAAGVFNTAQILELSGIGSRDRKSTRLNSSHSGESRMPSSA